MAAAGIPEEETRALQGATRHETPVEFALDGFRFVVTLGPDRGKAAACAGHRFTIGTALENDLVLSDRTVSRRHCEIVSTPAGLLLRDLNSTNGTRLGDCRVESAYVRPGTTIRAGSSELSFDAGEADARNREGHDEERTMGRSAAIQKILSIVSRVSQYDSPVLLEGETGTGKTLFARTIHRSSARAKGPFVVVDCGAIPPTLIESELFGHEKGAFTGAQGSRIGSFEAAEGGTIFLDEIGELPLDMQPKLLRALEDRVIKRLGSSQPIYLDVRIIAATNRDIAETVRKGFFRADLYYRLNTVSIMIPPLRERPDDISELADYFYQECVRDPEAVLPPELHAELVKHSWPGNARELRNAVQRLVMLGDLESDLRTPGLTETQEMAAINTEPVLSFREAKERAIALWEQDYVERLIRTHGGNLSKAARQVRMDRNHLRELVRRRGLGQGAGPPESDRKLNNGDG